MEPKEQVMAVWEEAMDKLLDLPESPWNKSMRKDLWYALNNLNYVETLGVSSDTDD